MPLFVVRHEVHAEGTEVGQETILFLTVEKDLQLFGIAQCTEARLTGLRDKLVASLRDIAEETNRQLGAESVRHECLSVRIDRIVFGFRVRSAQERFGTLVAYTRDLAEGSGTAAIVGTRL